MFGRKCWVEGPLSEHSAQIFLAECSDSFRRWFVWFLWGLLFSVFLFLFLAWCVNYTNRITTKRQMLCCGFEMFGIDILLPLRIRQLQGRRDELHQMVHDHAATLL